MNISQFTASVAKSLNEKATETANFESTVSDNNPLKPLVLSLFTLFLIISVVLAPTHQSQAVSVKKAQPVVNKAQIKSETKVETKAEIQSEKKTDTVLEEAENKENSTEKVNEDLQVEQAKKTLARKKNLKNKKVSIAFILFKLFGLDDNQTKISVN